MFFMWREMVDLSLSNSSAISFWGIQSVSFM